MLLWCSFCCRCFSSQRTFQCCGSRDPIGPIQNSSPTKLNVFYLIIRSYCKSGVVWSRYAIGKPPLNIKFWLSHHAQSKEHPLLSRGSSSDRSCPMENGEVMAV